MTPVIIVLTRSFTTGRLGAAGGFSFDNYLRVLQDPQILPMLENSVVYAGGSAIPNTTELTAAHQTVVRLQYPAVVKAV